MKLKIRVFIYFILLVTLGCEQNRPQDLGEVKNKLTACLQTQKGCVSSNSEDLNALEPLQFMGNGQQSKERLKSVILSMPNVDIKIEDEKYLLVVFTNSIFNLKDDLEIFLDINTQKIHYKLNPRIGYLDFGRNKKRIFDMQFRYYQNNK